MSEKRRQDQIALAGAHPALDELDDGALHVVSDAAEDHAKGGGRLALALAGVDDDQTALVGLGGHDLVAGGLLLGHLDGVAFGVIGHRRGPLGQAAPL
jgi:hypothetical protein